MTTSPLSIRDAADRVAYVRVERKVRLIRYGGDCYAYCALAAGSIDLVIETNLKPHDVVALTPIIEGAGGVISTWDGEDTTNGGRIIAASDRAVYDEARRYSSLRGDRRPGSETGPGAQRMAAVVLPLPFLPFACSGARGDTSRSAPAGQIVRFVGLRHASALRAPL